MTQLYLHNPTFSLDDIVSGLNAGDGPLSPVTVANWIKRGHLPQLIETNPGGGRAREFSYLEAVEITALHHLTSLTLPVATAAKLLFYFRERAIEKAQSVGHQRGGFALFLSGKTPAGELKVRPVYQDEFAGELGKRALSKPAVIIVFVDQVIDETLVRLSSVTPRRIQQDRGVAFTAATLAYWRQRYMEADFELDELKVALREREATPADEWRYERLMAQALEARDVLKEFRERGLDRPGAFAAGRQPPPPAPARPSNKDQSE